MAEQQALFEGIAPPQDGNRREADYYATPVHVTRALLPMLRNRVPRMRLVTIIEPAIGHGAIAHELVREGYAVHGVDIRQDAADECRSAGLDAELADFVRAPGIGDRLRDEHGIFDAAVTNPPFSIAQDFAEQCFKVARVTMLLLPLGFLVSDERRAFWREHPADLLPLDSRPNFTGDGKSAFQNYGWYAWPPREGARGTIYRIWDFA